MKTNTFRTPTLNMKFVLAAALCAVAISDAPALLDTPQGGYHSGAAANPGTFSSGNANHGRPQANHAWAGNSDGLDTNPEVPEPERVENEKEAEEPANDSGSEDDTGDKDGEGAKFSSATRAAQGLVLFTGILFLL